jgi:hypothetical protein
VLVAVRAQSGVTCIDFRCISRWSGQTSPHAAPLRDCVPLVGVITPDANKNIEYGPGWRSG